MFRKSVPYEYYILNETTVDPDIADKKRKILHENVVTTVDGKRLTTLTYQQVLQSAFRNWNGREYGIDDIINSIERNALIQHDLKMRTWTGEYGHPLIDKTMNELVRQMTIYPQYACNTIDKWWQDGQLIMGECTTLSDGFGEVLKNRILTGYPAMASSRAIGGVDRNGKVLRGYTLVTYDTVIRPSHKEAYQVKGSEKVNVFELPIGNTFNECAQQIDITKSESFKNFVLTESAQKVDMLCEALQLDRGTLTIDGKNMKIQRINENSVDTIVIPLKTVITSEYHNLFK